jgi:hypothetical protein
VLIGVFFLRNELRTLIARVTQFDFGPASLKVAAPPQSAPPTLAVDASVKESIENLPPEERPAATEASPEIAQLSQELEIRTVELEFEQTYRLIYNTQLQALSAISGYPGGLKPENLSGHLEVHKILSSNAAGSYKDIFSFMSFTIQQGLVIFDSSAQVFKITERGRVFLQYLNSKSIPTLVKYNTSV